MKSNRIIAITVVLLGLTMLSALNPQAQTCGSGFAEFAVLDSKGKGIPDVTIKLVAELSSEKYNDYLRNKPRVLVTMGMPFFFTTSAQEAEEIIKQGIPMSRTEDFCGNPLKQRATSTKVKKERDGEASIMNFGFCSLETYGKPFLLKISAPHYVTAYYAGPFLGGCNSLRTLILDQDAVEREE